MKISDIMTPNPMTLHPSDLIFDCIDIFNENRIHHIPVVTHDGEVVGMVSSNDFKNFQSITRLWDEGKNRIQVSDIMTVPVFSYYGDVSVTHAAMAMVDNHIHAIVVMSHNDKMIGIVTSTDLLRHLSLMHKS